MIEIDVEIRDIEPADQARHEREVQQARAEGDEHRAQHLRELFAEWEREQGSTKTELVCSVCRQRWLTPTRDGRARRHKRWPSTEEPGWDRVRQIQKQIKALQEELERLLNKLEPD